MCLILEGIEWRGRGGNRRGGRGGEAIVIHKGKVCAKGVGDRSRAGVRGEWAFHNVHCAAINKKRQEHTAAQLSRSTSPPMPRRNKILKPCKAKKSAHYPPVLYHPEWN